MDRDQWFWLFFAALFVVAVVARRVIAERRKHRLFLARCAEIDAEFSERNQEHYRKALARVIELRESPSPCSCSSCKFYNAFHNQE